MTDVTLDAGGLIALDWDDRRMVVVLMARARETAARVVVSATALAQAIRRPDRQVRLVQLVRPRGHLRGAVPGQPLVFGPPRAHEIPGCRGPAVSPPATASA